MTASLHIGLIGDRNDEIVAHRAIPRALALSAEALQLDVQAEWVGTETIASAERVERFDALWCVPGSPYRDMGGALCAIRHARERGVPFLGTCGGFQHAVIEYARNVLGWADAEHAESAPEAARPVIVPLVCSLVEVREPITLLPGTHLQRAYAVDEIIEGYHCRYGLAPELEASLTTGPLRVAARDANGDVRALELDGHPFYVATLFQPERAALTGTAPAIVRALLQAALRSTRFR